MQNNFKSPFGYTHNLTDKREMCQYCYNEDAKQIVDRFDLKPYEEYYKGKPFRVFWCFCCNATWHFPK
jgi:adenine specific DNA methylase Mod